MIKILLIPKWLEIEVLQNPKLNHGDLSNPEKLLTTLSDNDVAFYITANRLFSQMTSVDSDKEMFVSGFEALECESNPSFLTSLHDLLVKHQIEIKQSVENHFEKDGVPFSEEQMMSHLALLTGDVYVPFDSEDSLPYELKNLDENTIGVIPVCEESTRRTGVTLSKVSLVEHTFKMLSQRYSLSQLASKSIFRSFVEEL